MIIKIKGSISTAIKNEYDNFDRTMRKLLQVSHEEIKAQLDKEKKAKKQKKSRKSSASGREANAKG